MPPRVSMHFVFSQKGLEVVHALFAERLGGGDECSAEEHDVLQQKSAERTVGAQRAGRRHQKGERNEEHPGRGEATVRGDTRQPPARRNGEAGADLDYADDIRCNAQSEQRQQPAKEGAVLDERLNSGRLESEELEGSPQKQEADQAVTRYS